MKSITMLASLALALLVLPASSAQAERFGVGAQSMLTGPAGISVTYDAGSFHIDGIFSLRAGNNTNFSLGGQFWYVIHGGGAADLSVGGGLGVQDDNRGFQDDTDFHLSGGLKLRLFLAPNLALSSVVGLGFIFDNDDGDDDIVIDGQRLGSVGVTYFF